LDIVWSQSGNKEEGAFRSNVVLSCILSMIAFCEVLGQDFESACVHKVEFREVVFTYTSHLLNSALVVCFSGRAGYLFLSSAQPGVRHSFLAAGVDGRYGRARWPIHMAGTYPPISKGRHLGKSLQVGKAASVVIGFIGKPAIRALAANGTA
jgi:hypothetical protein